MRKVLFIIASVVWISACKKTSTTTEINTDNTGGNGTVVDTSDRVNPNSIIGIHHNIFKPTCANSGCHDGTFEPDFRTVESAYNTLLMQPIIKNNPEGNYAYRVVPGDAANSVLYRRLIEDIDGQSGIMPISIDPDSDYPAKREQYIQNVKTWINEGAKDVLGNPFTTGNQPPTFLGATVRFTNSSGDTITVEREGQELSTIPIPFFVDDVELWFSFQDDGTAPSNLGINQIDFSKDPFLFSGNKQSLEIPGFTFQEKGFVTEDVTYTHKISLSRANFVAGDTYYYRVYVSDDSAEETEIPNESSPDYIKVYFTLRWEDGD